MEKNYKKLYMEQKAISLNLEMQLMNLRARLIEGEMAEVQEELKGYANQEEKKANKK